MIYALIKKLIDVVEWYSDLDILEQVSVILMTCLVSGLGLSLTAAVDVVLTVSFPTKTEHFERRRVETVVLDQGKTFLITEDPYGQPHVTISYDKVLQSLKKGDVVEIRTVKSRIFNFTAILPPVAVNP